MSGQQVCGNCRFAATAYNYDGSLAPDFIICTVKEFFTQGRQPNPHSIVSAVYRMHRNRDACPYWSEEESFAHPLPAPAAEKEPPRQEFILQIQEGPSSQQQQAIKEQLLEKERLLQGLRNENQFLHDQLHQIREEMATLKESQENPLPTLDQDFFTLLGVQPNSPPAEIKQAYREKMKYYHPDRFAALARQFNLAYETLMDPLRKQEYLRQLTSFRG